MNGWMDGWMRIIIIYLGKGVGAGDGYCLESED
jgi:hypothetical protein